MKSALLACLRLPIMVAVVSLPSGANAGVLSDAVNAIGRGGDGQVFVNGFEDGCPQDCLEGEVCRYSQCVPAPSFCVQNSECLGDSYCDTGENECLPWGVGPGGDNDNQCGVELTPAVLFPETQCNWAGPAEGKENFPNHTNVISTPVVADFTQAGPDGPVRPWMVFTTYDCIDGGLASCAGTDPKCTAVIRVVDGRSCEQITNISSPVPIASAGPAVGDLDGDGIPEIVAAKVGGGLAAWKLNGTSFNLYWESASTYGAGQCNWTGPAIHDIDNDGVPEALLQGAVFNSIGTVQDDSLPANDGISVGYIPVVADIDADGLPELITGTDSYQWDKTDTWVQDSELAGLAANTGVADFGTYPLNDLLDDRTVQDGLAEVVAIASGDVVITNNLGRVLVTVAIPGGGFGGPPAIADFDGDGRAEVAVSGSTTFSIIDPDCTGTPDAAVCASQSTDYVLWSSDIQDLSSNRTGALAFDFDGDGAVEPVFADECFARVYDGASGLVTASRARTSCTFHDRPIIADVDADFLAEIVVPSNQNCNIVCPAVDPVFDGPRCVDDDDCAGATVCRKEMKTDELGQCRCEMDENCGDGYACLDPIAGPSAQGKVCRASNPGGGQIPPLQVIEDPFQSWADSRTIWNQDAYAITNIGDLGSVPQTEQWPLNWQQEGLNDFRANTSTSAGTLSDLTIRQASFSCEGSAQALIEIEVCNRGARPVTDGKLISVKDGETLACVATTETAIQPGDCNIETCVWGAAPTLTPVGLAVLGDDNGSSVGMLRECREDNNELLLNDVVCP